LKLVATGENVEGWGNKGFIFQDERGNMIATSAVVIAPDRDDPCLLNVYRMEGDGRYILEREIFGNMESIFRLTYLVGPNHEPFGVPVGLHWQCRQE